MQTRNNIAFKEWASVVNALAQGKQILILRKGGIREENGQFQVEHNEFFLFPTYEHQNKEDLKTEVHYDLEMTIRTKPEPNEIPIRYYVQIVDVLQLTEESDLTLLQPYHVWSEKAVANRFHFGKEKGLFAIAARIYRLPIPHLVAFEPEYGGCKSWVELKQGLSTEGARPVLNDADFQNNWRLINSLFLKSGGRNQSRLKFRS